MITGTQGTGHMPVYDEETNSYNPREWEKATAPTPPAEGDVKPTAAV